MQGATNAILNTILVSIPENIFLVVMTLIFLRRFDMLDVRMWKFNLRWILVPVIPVAIMINIFRYIIIIPKPIMSLICLIAMNILIVYIIYKNSCNFNKKVIFQTLIFTLVSFTIIGLIEILYIPIILSLLHQPINYFNNNIAYNLLLTLPARVIQICIISFIIIRKNNEIQINLFNTIIKNKFFTKSVLIFLMFLVLIIIYTAKLIMIDNILVNLKILDQIIIVLIIISIPIVLITWFLTFINYLLIKEKQIQQTYENLVIQDDIMFDVENDNERR